MEVELGSAIFVLAMCFTTVPFLTVSQLSLNFTPDKTTLNPVPTTVTGGASGSSYGAAFAGVPGSVEVPPWWFTVMGLSSGINQAVRTGIGSNMSGFRQLEEMARVATIDDPSLRAGLQRFTNECWVPARSKYLTTSTPLSAAGVADLTTYGNTDTEWIGSHVFQDEPGYYDTLAADSGVPGFPVDPVQDADVAGSAVPPDNGRPTCKAWWSSLRTSAVNQLVVVSRNPAAPAGTVSTLLSMTATLVAAPPGDVQDAMARLAIDKLRPSMVDPSAMLGDDRAWYQKVLGGAFPVLGGAGSLLQGVDAQASKFPVVQLATMAQPLILMAIYAFLPLIVVFSRYSLQVMFLGALAIFTVKFWTVMWFIARWLDDHLIQAMYPDAATMLGQALQVGASGGIDGIVKRTNLDTLLVGLYIGLPLVWSGMMMWAGWKIMYGISALTDSAIAAGVAAGNRGTSLATMFLGRRK
jgi:hypothetical protein